MKEIKIFNKSFDEGFKTKLNKLVSNFDDIKGGIGRRIIITTVELEALI